jgi:hypothetical protein
MDVDTNSTEPTSPMDDASGHLRHEMLGMGFDGMLSLDEGMSGLVVMVMGLRVLGGLVLGVGGLDGMGGMDMSGMGGMGSMGGIGSMGMEEMGVDMGMNMGGMGRFGSGHEHSPRQEHRREELGIMGMDYGKDHNEEGINISSTSSTGRANTAMGLPTHQQNQSQSHLQLHSEYQQGQPQLSAAQAQYNQQNSRSASHQHSLHAQHVHQVQAEQSHHQNQHIQPNQASQPNQQQPIMPVATPSSILNLGRLGGPGGRLGSALSASTSTGANAATAAVTGMVTRAKKATKATKDAGGSSSGGTASRRKSITMTTLVAGSGTGIGVSPGLKPLRPGKLSGNMIAVILNMN